MNAPYPNWAVYAPHLKAYAEEMMNKAGGGLPAGKSLKIWMEENRQALRGDPYLRDLNRVVAVQLLPLFQKTPEIWECVAHMPDTDSDFEGFLAMWEEKVSMNHRCYVESIAKLFA